jgi:hypothetical protein
MVRTPRLLLLVALAFAGALPAAVNKPDKSAEPTVTIHRCVDAKGMVTLQDDACPTGSQDSAKVMQRPKDTPALPPPPPALPAPEPEPIFEPAPAPIPPPDMFVCTSYDGIERYSESYDPNPRCEPLGLYYPPAYVTPENARMCRWVEDSCVKLSDEAACAVWEKKRKDAESAARRAFSDTAAYRKSELARITQIVNDSCR